MLQRRRTPKARVRSGLERVDQMSRDSPRSITMKGGSGWPRGSFSAPPWLGSTSFTCRDVGQWSQKSRRYDSHLQLVLRILREKMWCGCVPACVYLPTIEALCHSGERLFFIQRAGAVVSLRACRCRGVAPAPRLPICVPSGGDEESPLCLSVGAVCCAVMRAWCTGIRQVLRPGRQDVAVCVGMLCCLRRVCCCWPGLAGCCFSPVRVLMKLDRNS